MDPRYTGAAPPFDPAAGAAALGEQDPMIRAMQAGAPPTMPPIPMPPPPQGMMAPPMPPAPPPQLGAPIAGGQLGRQGAPLQPPIDWNLVVQLLQRFTR